MSLRRACGPMLGFAVLACTTAGPVPDDLGERIDRHLAPLVGAGRLSGVVLVGTPDSILTTRAYGRLYFPDGPIPSASTRFRIASLTKTMTAATVQILADRNRFRLTDSIAEWVPAWEPARRITIRQLLRHESGVANPDMEEAFRTATDLDGVVARVTARPLLFEPGTGNRYSNGGYSLLARIVEGAGGAPYDSVVRREILEPLGMTATRTVADPAADPEHARGHIPAPGRPLAPPLPAIGFSTGSGSLSSTADDLYRWGVALHRNRLFDLDRQVADDWPYGWGKAAVGSHTGVEQTGASTGFMASLSVFDDGTIVVVLLNQEYGGWSALGRDVARLAFGDSVAPIAVPAEAPPPTGLDRFAGRYRGDGGVLEVRAEDGALWLYGGTWPIGKWLRPVGPAEFTVPADAGTVRFDQPRDDVFNRLTWDFGESAPTWRRIRR